MILYSYKCWDCDKVVDEVREMEKRNVNFPKCPKCGKDMCMNFGGGKNNPSMRWPLTLDHITEGGKTFGSKQELIDFCKKEGVVSSALL